MKKNILTALMLVGAAAAPLYANAVENGNRPFYGFFLSNPGGFTNAPKECYGFAKQTFSDATHNELIYELSGGVGVYAATAIDGIYYAAPYLYESSMSMPTPRPLFSYNIYTGQVTELGEWSNQTTDLKPSDMTYDRKNDRLLAICYGSSEGGGIYEVDRKTGAMTLLRQANNIGGVIAADAFGRVFSINHEGQLLQIDMTKDNSAKVIYTLPYAYLAANQSLECDPTSGKLYWASNTLDNPHSDNGHCTWLVEITLPGIGPNVDYSADMQGYDYKEIGEIGYTSRFLGMYIPYATGGFEAPGFATDLKSESSVDGEYCTIEFKTPSTTFGGDELASIDGYDIYRNGEKIFNEHKNYAGGTVVKYEDKAIPATGKEYRYDIVCYSNTKGDGPKTPVFAYIGFDAPAQAGDPNVEVSDDFLSTTLTWSAPTEGVHGGTFDPSTTTYDVVRLPDNVKVASDITACSLKDNLGRRLLRYSYRITAKNAYGESSVVSPDFIAGPPVEEFPVEENFENPAAMANKWNSVDNNGDGMTWLYGTTLGQSVFHDYEMTAEYIISPTSVDAFVKDADDWIISPPIKFEAGKKYNITLDIRSLTPETLNIYTGARNVVEGMELVKTFGLREPVYDDETNLMVFQKYVVELPDDLGGTTACVGVQLSTPLNENYYSYIQVGNICIDDRTSGISITETDADAPVFGIKGNVLTVNGEGVRGAIYNLFGMKVKDVTEGAVSLEGLKGIYILNLDGKGYKFNIR